MRWCKNFCLHQNWGIIQNEIYHPFCIKSLLKQINKCTDLRVIVNSKLSCDQRCPWTARKLLQSVPETSKSVLESFRVYKKILCHFPHLTIAVSCSLSFYFRFTLITLDKSIQKRKWLAAQCYLIQIKLADMTKWVWTYWKIEKLN